MAYIRSGDAALYYEEYGGGPPLILLPGLLGTLESTWRRFVPDFAQEFHVVLTDLRGHGRTNNPGGRFSLDLFVEDLRRLIETLDVEPPAIAGYSLGGAIGLEYGLRYPGGIRALVSHAMKWFWTPADIARLESSLDPELLAAGDGGQAARLQADHAPGNGEDGWRTLTKAAREFLHSSAGTVPPAGRLAGARFPVLLTTCGEDAFVPPDECRSLAALLPDAETGVIAGCRHPVHTMPRRPFAEATAGFLRRHAGPSPP